MEWNEKDKQLTHPEAWEIVQLKLRRFFLFYQEDAKQEHDITTHLSNLQLQYHRIIQRTKHLNGWLHYLEHHDTTAIDRNEWDEKLPIRELNTAPSSLSRYEPLIRLLRSTPSAIAALAKATNWSDPAKPEADDVIEQNNAAIAETFVFSLYGSLSDKPNLILFRSAVNSMLAAEYKSAKFENAIDFFLQHHSSSAASGSSSTSSTSSSHRPSHSSHKPLRFHILEMYLRRIAMGFVARQFGEPMRNLLARETPPLDPNPVQILSDLRPRKQTTNTSDDGLERRSGAGIGGGGSNAGLGGVGSDASGSSDKQMSLPLRGLTFLRDRIARSTTDLKKSSMSSTSSSASLVGGSGGGGGNANPQPSPVSGTRVGLKASGNSSTLQPKSPPTGGSVSGASPPGTSSGLSLSAGSTLPSPMGLSATTDGPTGNISTQKTRQAIKVTQRLLCQTVDTFVRRMISATKRWSFRIRILVGDLLAFANENWPKTYATDRLAIVSGLLYGFLVIPAIKKPTLSGLSVDGPVPSKGKKNIHILCVVLKQIISGQQFEPESYLHVLNPYVQKKSEAIKASLEEFASICEHTAVINLQSREPILQWKPTLCLSVRQLIHVHKTLFRYPISEMEKDSDFTALIPFKDLPQTIPADGPKENEYYLINLAPPIPPTVTEIVKRLSKFYKGKEAKEIADQMKRHGLDNTVSSHPPLPSHLHSLPASAAAHPTHPLPAHPTPPTPTRKGLPDPHSPQHGPMHPPLSGVPHHPLPPLVLSAREREEKFEKIKKNVETKYGTVQTLIQVLIYLDSEVVHGYTGSTTDLGPFLDHIRHGLESRLAIDWEETSRLLALLTELFLVLRNSAQEVLSAGCYFLRKEAQLGLNWLRSEHDHTFSSQKNLLRIATLQASTNLTLAKTEMEFLNAIVFHDKVMSFCHSVEIPCRLQLPPSIRSRASLVSIDGLDPAQAARKKGPFFSCNSLETFINEYLEYEQSLSQHRNIAAKLYHTFLRVVEQRVASDVAFKEPDSHHSHDAASGGSGNSNDGDSNALESKTQAARAMDLIAQHICSRLFHVMYSSDRSQESMEDEMLTWKIKSLKEWIKPKHLQLNISDDPLNWRRAMQSVRKLDSVRSPHQKLHCLVNSVKWLGKMLQIKGGGGFDADTILSALIYVIIQAKPERLRSNLSYIEIFLPPEKMMGEGAYCLTQFTLAVSCITDSLAETNQAKLEQQIEEKARESARHKPVYESHKSIFRITANVTVRERIIVFCSSRDINCMMAVCRQWRVEWRDTSRALQAISAANNAATGGGGAASGPPGSTKNFPWDSSHPGKMESILENTDSRVKFIKFCESIYCDEYVHFYLDVEAYKKLPNDSHDQFTMAEKIFEKYIRQGAASEIGAQAAMRQQVKDGIENHKANPKNSGSTGAIEAKVDINFDASGPIQGRTRATTLTRHAEQSLNIAFDSLQKRVLSMMRIDMMPKYLNSL